MYSLRQSTDICFLGLSEAVREGYSYLATNWEVGDEIFLFGFSRGA
jgi:uncharacterized protein (DUF2235 family)